MAISKLFYHIGGRGMMTELINKGDGKDIWEKGGKEIKVSKGKRTGRKGMRDEDKVIIFLEELNLCMW
jgi:hypothetical protein